jgi:Helix-turn-helix domain
MSFQATKFVINLRDLSPSQKAVAHAFAHHADQTGGNSFPAMETIASESGLKTRRGAQLVVRQLERMGIIIAETAKTGGRGRRTTTIYRLNMAYLPSAPPGNSEPERAPSPEGGANPGTRGSEPQFAGGVNPSSQNSEPQFARIVLNSPSISKREVRANQTSALPVLTSETGRQLPTTVQAKKLCRQIQAYLQKHYDVALTGKGRDDLLAGITETPLHPAEIWYFAVVDLISALEHSDNDGFARSQAASRVPTTIACAFEPTAPGAPTIVDRFYERKAQPFHMEIERAKARKEVEQRLEEERRRYEEEQALIEHELL